VGAGRGGLGLHQLLVLLHGPLPGVRAAVLRPPVADAAAAVGLGGLQDLHSGAGARGRQPSQRPAPALHAAGLFIGRQEHVCRVAHAGDRGQGLPVRVMDHDGVGRRVGEPAQGRRISGQRQGSGGAGLVRPYGIPCLSLSAARQEVRRGGCGLDEGPPGPRHEGRGQEADPEGGGGGRSNDPRDEQRRDEHRCRGDDARDPGGGEAKQQAAR